MKPNWKWYVYILECKDGSYYTGMTWQPDDRWAQHLSGLGAEYTHDHPPKRLAYLEEYEELEQAEKNRSRVGHELRRKN